MHIASYLALSRHNVYYFRYPLPSSLCPPGHSRDIKISLQTREPKRALQSSRLLAYAGDIMTNKSVHNGMSYGEIRAALRRHFTACLQAFRSQTDSRGPLSAEDVQGYQNLLGLGLDYSEALLSSQANAIISRYSLPLQPGTPALGVFKAELVKAHKDYCKAALDQNSEYDGYSFDAPEVAHTPPTPAPESPAVTLHTLISKYSEERVRGGNWTTRTASQYKVLFAFLEETLGAERDCKALSLEDGRKVKDALSVKCKSNTRKGVAWTAEAGGNPTSPHSDTISVKTINKHIVAYGGLFKWGNANGFTDANIFDGLIIRQAKKNEHRRTAFTPEQINRMYWELTTFPAHKEYQKWGPLLGIFTGARLNEIAQLKPENIRQIDGIWCLDINDQSVEQHLKTQAAKRVIPVHSKLIELGFLGYVDAARNSGRSRLLHELTYDKNNGYGRNLGRWFNEKFLTKLGFNDGTLVFHCLRHTMVTELLRADVPDGIAKAIVGHAQDGVTKTVYFEKGYKTEQLQSAIERVHQHR